jgi:hypothetical protein
MNAIIFANRIRLSNQNINARNAVSGSAIVSSYQQTRTDIGLIEVRTADGGISYQTKIYNRQLAAGETIPASVRSSGYGFADGKAVL